MKMKKILLYSIITLFVSSLYGCKEWLDVNTSPNDATTAVMTPALVISSQQYDILNNLVNSTYAWQISHHLTKSGEFSGNYTFLNGQIMPQNLDSWWSTYYIIAKNLKWIENKAIEQEDLAYQGIAKALWVHNFQRMVDIWGDIPYSQACKPDEYQLPKYDKGEDIYDSLLIKIDEAIACFDAAIGHYSTSALSKVDIMCFGDLEKWRTVSYTLKLRLLMRISGVRDVSKEVAAIADKCLPIDQTIEANPGYIAESGKMNKLYETYGWDKNGGRNSNHREYMPTSILVDLLRDNNDPRLRVFAQPRVKLGDDPEGFAKYSNSGLENERYVGIPYGQESPASEDYTCITGTGLLAGSWNGGFATSTEAMTRSTTFIAGSEVGFLLAEAALRGMIPGGDAKAKEYYEAAVTAAMKRHETAMQSPSENFLDYAKNPAVGMRDPIPGTAEEAAKEFLSQNNPKVNWDLMGSTEAKMEAIGTQKWLSFVGYNPLEAWFEHRRLDYPVLPCSNQIPEGKNIARLIYPQSERNLNAANVPADHSLYDTVFWDKENPMVGITDLYL